MNTTLVLLDTGNLHYCVSKKYPNSRIDYKQVRNLLNQDVQSDDLSITAYGAIANPSAFTFRDALRHYGFVVKFKELGNGVKYYNPIVDIVLESVNNVEKVNTIVLGSSNQEFLPLIGWLKARSVSVGIWACNIGYELQKAVNFYREIDREVLVDTSNTKE